MDNGVVKMLASIGLFILAFAGFFWECFVIWKLWQWYGVPLGGAYIPFGAVIALSLIFYMSTDHLRPDRGTDTKALIKRLNQQVFGSFLAFILGWLLK